MMFPPVEKLRVLYDADTIRARVTQPKLCRAPFDKRNSQRRPARNRQRRPARKEEKTACGVPYARQE